MLRAAASIPAVLAVAVAAGLAAAALEFAWYATMSGIPAERVLLSNLNFSRSEEHTSELQSLMRISYAVFCLKKKKPKTTTTSISTAAKLIKEHIKPADVNTTISAK